MAIPSRTAKPGTYFITTATHHRRRLFQIERNATLLLETIDHHRASYLLHAYVVMPDHVHILVTPIDGYLIHHFHSLTLDTPDNL